MILLCSQRARLNFESQRLKSQLGKNVRAVISPLKAKKTEVKPKLPRRYFIGETLFQPCDVVIDEYVFTESLPVSSADPDRLFRYPKKSSTEQK